ncbi:UNVERIFIED_CONTAM: hypothetical protein GTU68_025897 [Idotea baltica]|nr:hypothetical protein [Idotea baltica]
MATLLAGVSPQVPAATINRLCGSGLDAVGTAARVVMSGEADLLLAGGVESMSRAPMVIPKADTAFSRQEKQYGAHSMPLTAENVAEKFNVSREDQDAFAYRSQQRALVAMESGRLAEEIIPITIKKKRGDDIVFDTDEHPRQTSLEKMSALPTPFRENGTVTAGNASGINDGAAALIVASENAVAQYGLQARAKILGMSTAGVEPRIMGIGPAPASEKLLSRFKLSLNDIDVIELNEAFAAQALAVTRSLGLKDDDSRVNPNGGAIALGHPLGMSGTRIALSASLELQLTNKRFALCTMCIGVGQGISLLLERV